MKIVIKNDTVWPTRMLRPFIVRVANHEFDGSTPNRRPRPLHVTIVYTDGQGGCSGHAYLRSGTSTIRVPHPHTRSRYNMVKDPATGELRPRRASDPPVPFPVHDFVHVLAHEFGHNVGLTHADMGWHYRNRSKAIIERTFPWVTSLPVPVVTKKAAPPRDVKRAAKLDAARAAVARWTRKRKLADTKVKLWTRKVRVLERTLAAAACEKDNRPAYPMLDSRPGDGTPCSESTLARGPE